LELANATPRPHPPRLIEKSALEKLLGESESPTHDDSPLRRQPQLVCRLRFLAIEILRPQNVKLINGGRRSGWKRSAAHKEAEGHTDHYAFPALTTHSAPFRDDVLAVVQRKEAWQLVDVRSVDEFTGKSYRASDDRNRSARRHIPSAAIFRGASGQRRWHIQIRGKR